MAGILKISQLAENDCMAEMDVGSRGIDAQLDGQGPTFSKQLLEATLGKHIHRPLGEGGGPIPG
jgi:hypothetical protein